MGCVECVVCVCVSHVCGSCVCIMCVGRVECESCVWVVYMGGSCASERGTCRVARVWVVCRVRECTTVVGSRSRRPPTPPPPATRDPRPQVQEGSGTYRRRNRPLLTSPTPHSGGRVHTGK